MENKEEDVKIIPIDTEIIEAQNRSEIDVQIATAKKYPRNILRAKENAIVVATIDEETAKSCGYTVPRGGKSVSGPSVHLAKILVQQWGNLRVSSRVLKIEEKQITSEAVCHDLENNVAVKVEVKRSIYGKNGRFSEDMITVTGNAANAIAFRNAVIAVIPKAIVDATYNASRAKMLGDVSDENKFLKKRASIFDGLKNKLDVSEERALRAIGLTAIGQVTQDHLIQLVGIAQAIKDGDTTVEQAFPFSVKESAKDLNQKIDEKMKGKKKGDDNKNTDEAKP
jgi:hypothetical protein